FFFVGRESPPACFGSENRLYDTAGRPWPVLFLGMNVPLQDHYTPGVGHPPTAPPTSAPSRRPDTRLPGRHGRRQQRARRTPRSPPPPASPRTGRQVGRPEGSPAAVRPKGGGSGGGRPRRPARAAASYLSSCCGAARENPTTIRDAAPLHSATRTAGVRSF